jgi:hypothetical protein
LMHNILQCNWFSPRPAALRKPVQAPVHGFQVWRFVFYFLLTAVFFVVYGSAQGSSACAAVWQCGSVSSVRQCMAVRQCAAVCGSACVPVWQCVTFSTVVCGSAALCGSARGCVRQCAQPCAAVFFVVYGSAQGSSACVAVW